MTLWIPGAKGLVGATLAEIAGSCLTTGREVDISDFEAVARFVKQHPEISQIINCAACSQVDRAEIEREEAFQANAIGPENLARIAKEIDAHLIHLSTDYVFPGDIHRPLTEEDPVGPCNYYGETKLEGERRVFKENPKACVLRTSWVFGSGGRNFIARLFDLLKGQEEVRLIEDQWGRPTYALDLAHVLLQMQGKQGVYQFANQGVTTKFSFGCFLRDELEKLQIPLTVKRIIAAPGTTFASNCKRPQYSAFDTTKIQRFLNLSIRPWQDALCEYLCNVLSPIS